MSKRDPLRIRIDILTALRERSSSPTRLARSANLEYGKYRGHESLLERAKLVALKRLDDGTQQVSITAKGLHYLARAEEIVSLERETF